MHAVGVVNTGVAVIAVGMVVMEVVSEEEGRHRVHTLAVGGSQAVEGSPVQAGNREQGQRCNH